MATDKELVDLNDFVYEVDPNYVRDDGKKQKQIKAGDILPLGNFDYEVLSVKNGDYGFQGMAVAPIVNGTPDYGQVTVVAAGTLTLVIVKTLKQL